MENVSKGLSSITESDIENNLQYVESEELEQTWKNSRRQRLKHREDKIWKQFCGEKDIVTNACSDDPYQFLEQIPEWKLKQLMELELEMLKKEEAQEEVSKGGAGDAEDTNSPLALTYDIIPQQDHTECNQDVNIVETVQPSSDHQARDSDPEDNKSEGVNTVRDLSSTTDIRHSPVVSNNTSPAPTTPHTGRQKGVGRNTATNNIYCDKILELRNKIIANIKEFIESIETQNILDLLPENLTKLNRHSKEFCARLNRNYIYPIMRQMSDIRRHQSRAFPLAQHTHYQAQLVRIHSAHQHILQALMIFSKNFGQTIIVEETISQLMNYITTLRECDEMFSKINAPVDMKAAKDLFNDELPLSCDHLELCLMEYKEKMDTVIGDTNERKTKTESKIEKNYDIKAKHPLRKAPTKVYKPVTDAKLSMYSVNQTISSIHLRSSRTCTSNRIKRSYLKKSQEKLLNNKQSSSEVLKKIPSSNRPLMRNSLKTSTARSTVKPSDENIQTLVENMDNMVNKHYFLSKKSKDSTPKSKTRKKTANSPKLAKTKRLEDQKIEKDIIISGSKDERDKPHCDSDTHVTRNDDKRVEHNDLTSTTENEKKAPEPERHTLLDHPDPHAHHVTELLRNLCGPHPLPSKNNQVEGAKNAQLICINSSSPRHTTPQLLKILDKSIEKKSPKHLGPTSTIPKEHQLLQLNVPDNVEGGLMEYRLRFLEHILANPLYANTKFLPSELINRASDIIVEDLLAACARDLQLSSLVTAIYNTETTGL